MLKKFWDYIVRMQERRAALHTLNRMSDRELKDLGITRAEINKRVMLLLDPDRENG